MRHFFQQWRDWLLLAAGLAVLGAFLVLDLTHERRRIEQAETERLRNQTKVVEDNLTRQLNAIHRSLQSIELALPRWESSLAGNYEGQQTLGNMGAAMSAVHTFFVTDALGAVTFSNRPELIGKNFFERDFVQESRRALNPNRMYVSAPFSTLPNLYPVNLTHVRLDAQGQFAGVVSAAADPVEMDILLNSVRYSDDMQALLVHADGKIFVTAPADGSVLGLDLAAESAFFREHVQGAQGVRHFNGPLTALDVPRLTVMRNIAPTDLAMDKALVVVLNRSQAALFGAWQKEAFNWTVLYLLLVVFSGVGLAVYQRQRAQKLLAAQRLKLATEASGVGIWEFDLVTKKYQLDDAMFALFGLDPKQASPRNDDWIRLLTAPDVQRMREATRATIQQNQPFNMTFQIHRLDGQLRYLHNRAALYSGKHGVPRRLIGSTEDVTQRRQQEVELRIAAVAFETHESMVVTDAQVKILRVNQAFMELFGYTASDVVGHAPKLVKSGRHDADFYAGMWSGLINHRKWQGEIWNRRKDGTEFPCWLCITAVCDDSGVVTHYVATHTDITRRKAIEEEVRQLAFFDPLTNLPNRRLLTDRLQNAVTHAKRESDHLALFFVDLDKFKPVNDIHGHAAGDQLLQAVATRLRGCVRECDTVARVGGDEFVLLLGGIVEMADAILVAEKIQTALQQPFHLDGGLSVHISSSTGVALYPEHGLDEATLSRHADVAMYCAKAAGRDRYVVYNPSLDETVAADLADPPR